MSATIVPFKKYRLLTDTDLILLSSEGEASFPAVKFWKEKGVPKMAVVKFRMTGPLLLENVTTFDDHGTIKASLNLLRMAYRREEIGRTPRYDTPIFRTRMKRIEDMNVFLIANWEAWNNAAVWWAERNAFCSASEFGIGSMPDDTFQKRCERLGLKYKLGKGTISRK